jgi:hypothetical protein
VAAQRIMRRDKQAEGWTWIPAEAQTQGRSRASGGLILATACLSIGIVIGRVSVSTQDDAERGSTSAQVPLQPAPEPSPELSGWSEPKPLVAKAEAPILALGSEPRDKRPADTGSPAPTDTPILLNTETAGPPMTLVDDERRARWKRALAKRKWNSRSSRSAVSRGTSRDYRALREYVLSK